MKRTTAIIVAAVAIAVIVIGFVVFYVFTNRPAPSVYVNPQTVNAIVGQNFTVDVVTSDVTDLYAWQLRLYWNTTVLDLVNVTEGAFLKSRGETFFSTSMEGNLTLYCALLGNVSGVNGGGILATVEFHAKIVGNGPLHIYDTVLASNSEQTITHTTRDGYFVVTP